MNNHYCSIVPSAAINIIWGQAGGEGAFTAARRYLFHILTKYREAKEAPFHASTSLVQEEINVVQNFPTVIYLGLGNVSEGWITIFGT